MSELDEIKEQIAQLRTWLDILAMINVGLVVWLAANYKDAEKLLLILDCLAIERQARRKFV